jgi:hypothetical protein
MAEDPPGSPGSDSRRDQPGEPPTEPLGGPVPTAQPPPSSGPAGGDQQAPSYGPATQEPQPSTQQDGYGASGHGYPPGPQTEGLATAALVVAIAGFFICPPVGAIVALVLASNARQRIEASGGRLSGLEQARAARIIAIIELVLTAIVVLLLAIGAGIAVKTSGGQNEPRPVPTSNSALWSMDGEPFSSWATPAGSADGHRGSG